MNTAVRRVAGLSKRRNLSRQLDEIEALVKEVKDSLVGQSLVTYGVK